MYKLFLCLRYLRRRRIVFLSITAVCLCSAMVLIVVSVMNGFLQMMIDRSRGALGDLVMGNGSLQGFPFYQEFIDEIHNDPELNHRIQGTASVIRNYGVIRFEDNITLPVLIVGIRLNEYSRINDFKKTLFYEKYYPDTVSLASQKQPFFGWDAKGHYFLPPNLEAAYGQWLKSASPKDREEAAKSMYDPCPRPGFFKWMPYSPYEPTEPEYLGDEMPGVIIGRDIVAKRLPTGGYNRGYYWLGSPVTLTFVPFTEGGALSATGAPSKKFRYADDCKSGMYEMDAMNVYIDFDLFQNLLDMNEERGQREPNVETDHDLSTEDQAKASTTTHQASLNNEPSTAPASEPADEILRPARTTEVQFNLTPKYSSRRQMLATRDLLAAKWDQFRKNNVQAAQYSRGSLLEHVTFQTWEEKQARLIGAIEKEKYLVTTMFGIISIVAIILIVCIFYMIVQQKTRDIGIVKSVGATAFGVAQIFLAYGAAVGVVGGILGMIIGTLFVRYINEVQALLEYVGEHFFKSDWRVWNPEVYAFDHIPNQVQVQDVIVIFIIAILMSVIGSIIAAYQASRIWPVEALRYE